MAWALGNKWLSQDRGVCGFVFNGRQRVHIAICALWCNAEDEPKDRQNEVL